MVAITNPTPIQSIKTAHKKNVTNAEIDNPRAKAKRTLDQKRENAKRTRNAGSSRAHWSFVSKKKIIVKFDTKII